MRGHWMQNATFSMLMLGAGLMACDSSTTKTTTPPAPVATATPEETATPATTVTPAMPAAAVTPAPADHSQAANEFVDMLVAGEFAKAEATFDPTMQQALPEDKLREAWASIIAKTGAFRSRGAVISTREAGFEIIYVPCVFEQGALDCKVVYNKAGRVSGLWFK